MSAMWPRFRVAARALLAATCFVSVASAQTNWARTYGGANEDQGTSIRLTSDGGFIIAGYTHSFVAGWYDAYLIKTDASGDTLWTRTYGATATLAGVLESGRARSWRIECRAGLCS